MAAMKTPIAESLKFTDFIMELVTSDLTGELTTRRARGDDGASIAWVIGHLAHHRHAMLKLLGHELENTFAEQFATSAASDGSDYPELANLKDGWAEVSARLKAVMDDVTDDQLMSATADPNSPHGEKRVLDTLVFLMWHEAYHMGQLGTLRTQFGLTPTATLAVEAPA